MASPIHCRRRDGKLVFRIWSTVVDRYDSLDGKPLEMDEQQLRGQILFNRFHDALIDVFGFFRDGGFPPEVLAALADVADVAARQITPLEYAQVEQAIRRAKEHGASGWTGSFGGLDGPWETER